MNTRHLILAPLRGVTLRCFREVFADVLAEVGFTEAVTPFICANCVMPPMNFSTSSFSLTLITPFQKYLKDASYI